MIVPNLDRAKKACDKAFKKLSADERKALFAHMPKLVKNFGPQLVVDKETEPVLEEDLRFCEKLADTDWSALTNAVGELGLILDLDYWRAVRKDFIGKLEPLNEKIPGVSGDILYKKETPHGLILVGGKGANTYDLKVPVALLIDIGGDDHYKGVIG